MAAETSNRILLLEGSTDRYVVDKLCTTSGFDCSAFAMKPNKNEPSGISEVLKGIPVLLKSSELLSLGIVVDADNNCQDRWQAISSRLKSAGYASLPNRIQDTGFVSVDPHKPRVGVWIMPNNCDSGSLENFVLDMVPASDPLMNAVKGHIHSIESQGLHLYNPATTQSKAVIHSWLACQKEPGKPLGQALVARYLHPNNGLTVKFLNWLRLLRDNS